MATPRKNPKRAVACPLPSAAMSEEVVVGGQDDRLHPAASPELSLDGGDMVPGGEPADPQQVSDLHRGPPGGEEPEDLQLAPGEGLGEGWDVTLGEAMTEPLAPAGRYRGRLPRVDEVEEVGRPAAAGRGEDDGAADRHRLPITPASDDLITGRRASTASVGDHPAVAPTDGMAAWLPSGHHLVTGTPQDLGRRPSKEGLRFGRPGDDPLSAVGDVEGLSGAKPSEPINQRRLAVGRGGLG
jgi:hypothetical protein